MTTKQIAEAVGKDERSVRRWITSLADIMSVIADKLSASSPMKPADYNIEETCQIIEEGLGKAAADVYRTNAVNAEMGKKPPRITGALLAEVNRAYSKGLVDRSEAREIIGLKNDEKMAIQDVPQIEPPARLSRQAYAVEMRNRENASAKRLSKEKTPGLFGDDA